MKKVLFITGQREEVAKIFCDKAPAGFDVSWLPYPRAITKKQP